MLKLDGKEREQPAHFKIEAGLLIAETEDGSLVIKLPLKEVEKRIRGYRAAEEAQART